MKFSLVSDLHIDFPQPKTPYAKLEKNVIVAGDTSNGLVGLKFLNKLRNKGHDVVAIDGNHEHYKNTSQGRTVEETTISFRKEFAPQMRMDGIPVIGTNGWYPVDDAYQWFGYMNDGQCAFGQNATNSALRVNVMATRDYDDLRVTLRMMTEKCIVVTHTAPCLETLNPEYDGEVSNQWYWNPLMERLLEKYSDKILVWCHGHTHAKNEAIVHGVRVICNPRGYPGENPDWEPMTVEV